eukprot:gb/GFBE01042151.1/.p1 GENE.gb/GFBE01042151.1/~~gb/GFBE01042151.1/.p1  ORF type:complete len:963 (+),score=290.52 gb/GFBE01042151.1/:1-2889(+)
MIAMLQTVYEVVLAAKLEIGVFILAAGLHFLLFSNHSPRKPAALAKQGKKHAAGETGNELPPTRLTEKLVGPPATLLRALKPMLRSGAKQRALMAEIQSVMASQKVSPTECNEVLAAVLETLGRSSADAELLSAVRSVIGDAAPSGKLAEQLLRCYMGLRARGQFDALLAEVESACDAEGTRLPHGVAALALQSSLGNHDLEAALARLPDVATGLAQQTTQLKPRDQQIMQQLIRLAGEQGSVTMLLETLVACGLCTAPVLEPVMMDASARKDNKLLEEAEKLASDRGLAMTPASRCASLLGMVARSCTDEEFLQRYETSLADVDVLTVHTKTGRAVAEAALRLGRKDVLTRLLKDSEDARKVGLLKSFGAEGRLAEAKQLFEACPVKSVCLHNALLDATIGAGDASELETAMGEAQRAGVADVVTYNTVIKGHLQKGDLKSAKKVLEAMRIEGLKPNAVTFNELIDASATNGRRADWSLIEEMRSCGLKPNKVTCSILLKSLAPSSPFVDVERTMALLEEMTDEMDEVLLSSVCEACIRTSRSDLLWHQLQQQKGPKAVKVQGAHTYGSLIRAYGFVNDLEGVWGTWREMTTRHVVPTSITLGCMVEALVTNDEIEAGYDLIQQMAQDEATKPLVNAVIYGSILKGFCRQKRFSRVWTIYEEMLAEKMQFSIVTYNSLIDACARSGEMHRVQPLLEDMSKQGILPNVITYSTVLKGYCAANRLNEAFELLEDMKKNSNIRPDEVTYNTLLDGCARYGLFEKGMKVMDEMRAAGVPPSNFTLSVLVKLATRAKRPSSKAFELCDSIAKEFKIRLNVHVYNNLIQACLSQGNDLRKALDTTERMFSEKVRPDPRTYALMLRACINGQRLEDSIQLLRSASGLRGGHHRLQAFGSIPALRGGASALPRDLLTEVLDFLCNCSCSESVVPLVKELLSQPGMQLDQKLCQRYASKAMQLQQTMQLQ